MAIYFNNIEVTNQIYRLAWMHVMESENKSKFGGGGKGGVLRGDSVSLFCNKLKLKGINHHKPWLGTVDVAKEDTIFTTSTSASGDGKLKNQLYSKRKDVRLRYRHTGSESTRVVLQHGQIRTHKRINSAVKKRRGRNIKNANAKGRSGRPEPIMEGVEVVTGKMASSAPVQKTEREPEKSKVGEVGDMIRRKEGQLGVSNDKEMAEQSDESMQETTVSNNAAENADKNNNVEKSSGKKLDGTINKQGGFKNMGEHNQTIACSTMSSNESTAGVVVSEPVANSLPIPPHNQHIKTTGNDTTTTGYAVLNGPSKTTGDIIADNKLSGQESEKAMVLKIDEMNLPCNGAPQSLLKLVDQQPGCSTSSASAGPQPAPQTLQNTLQVSQEGSAGAGEEDHKLPNSMLSYPLLVDIYKGNMRAKEIDSATICQKEKEINEKLSSSTLPDICITNVVKSAQSLGKGIRECIAIYKNVKELKERIHNRSLPEILNTENEDKINKVKHLLFEISESVALYDSVRSLEKELTSPPRKDKANRDVWKRKVPGRTRKQLSSRVSSSVSSNFQESDEDGIEEEGGGEVGEEVGKDNNVVIVVDEEDEGEQGDIEDIADDDSSEDEKKNLMMMEKLNEKLNTAVNVV